MRYLLSLAIFFSWSSYAQTINYNEVREISQVERTARQHYTQRGDQTSLASDNFDARYYRCEWEIDPSVRFIKGKVTMYFFVPAVVTSITLDLASQLITDSVQYHAANIAFTRPTDALQITFPQAINAGTLDSITISYQGIPPSTGFGSFIQDSHSGTPVAWSLSEPYGSKDWWPCKTNLGDKADSLDVFITHPSIYKAASNGLFQYENAVGSGKSITYWKHRYPIASYLVCFAVTNYSVFNNSVQLGNTLLPMQTYCYPENLATFEENTPKVLEALKLFHNTFGDYPFIREKYGHVQFGWGGGMEHQTSTFIIVPDESLMAHELGHQWFGDKITTNSWADIWLNEGFATFLAAYYMENAHPENRLINRQAVLNNITGLPNGSVKVDDTTNLGRIFDGRLSYNKGSYLLNMLRFKLGDSTFFNGIRRYQRDSSVIYGFARTADLKRNLEAISGIDLTTFFNNWYLGQGYPSYHVSWSQVGAGNVQIKMNQTTSDPSVAFFEMPVALKFKNTTQEATVIVNNTFNGQSFIRNIGFIADTVFVDPQLWLISKNNTTQKVAITNSGNGAVEIYPNPVTVPLTIYLHDFNATASHVNIYNAAGQLMFKKDIALVNGTEILQVNMAAWAKGMYVIKVKTGGNIITRQIVK